MTNPGPSNGRNARKSRVCFLFNAQRHQLLHGISSAVALSRKPGFEVTVMSPSADHIAYAEALARRLGGGDVAFVMPDMATLETARRFTGRTVPPKLLTLAMIAPQLRRFDAIALPERTSILLKTLGLIGPSFIHLDHGAGDRAAGFDTRIRKFDFVLMAGEKHRRRLLREGLIREGAFAVTGYPKFEAADAARDASWTPFPNDPRPIVLYNPHFSALGSWERCGAGVLRAFAEQNDYNLIFAPHVRLLDGKAAAGRWNGTLEPYQAHPRIYIDRGSDRSIDMTYTTLADIYLGDVSSQVYEFLRTPRPCLFLDAHGVEWEGDEDYAHWRYGPVIRDVSLIMNAIETARTSHGMFLSKQEEGFGETFDKAPVSGSERAAQAIAGHVVGRRYRQTRRWAERRRADRRRPISARLSRRAAVIAAAVIGGWAMHDIVEPPAIVAAPVHFVDEAVASHKVMLLRDEMRSQPSTPAYDVEDIRRNTSIRMPQLPAGWRVIDVQVFPSDAGPSVQVLAGLPTGERIALIGMRIDTPAGQTPKLDRREEENVAYWEEGDLAFALVGRASSRRLLTFASTLSAQS